MEGAAPHLKDLKGLSASIPPELSFKKNARIIFTATDHAGSCSRKLSGSQAGTPRPYFVNGMTGVIMDFDGEKDKATIRTDAGDILEVFPMKRPIYTYAVIDGAFVKKKAASYIQFPFTLSYSMTIHKAQNQTFSSVIVNPGTFAARQLYVALSRVSSLGGLALTRSIKPHDVKADKICLAFYERLEKKANLSHKKGRPPMNTDGSTRSTLIWVPNALVPAISEELRLNRIIGLQGVPAPVKGRKHMRVPDSLCKGIIDQIQSWRDAVQGRGGPGGRHMEGRSGR